jgi:hypothetical protein
MSAAQTEITWEEARAAILRHATEDRLEEIAALVTRLAQPMLKGSKYRRFFRACENAGVHVTPVHFYQPLPDTRLLPEWLWEKDRPTPGLDWNEAGQLRLLREEFPKFRHEYDGLPTAPTGNPAEFYLNCGMFDGTDALALYCMVRHFKPRTVLEIGSGMSSLLTAQAARLNGGTELVCVEPYPNEVLKAGFPGLAKLIAEPVQSVGVELFESLGEDDILFIDSSHVVQIGGDVNYLFLEVLPRLKPGVVVHVHDIFLPREYRRDWVMDEFRFWNEQYFLQAFLIFNSGYEVLFANSYLGQRHAAEMRATFPRSPWWGGGSFWMRRK